MIATCPPSDRWQDYLLGKLPEQDSDELDGHLAGCDSCQQQLEASDSHSNSHSDSFIGLFKVGCESESFREEPALWQATDRAKDIAALLNHKPLGDSEIAHLGLVDNAAPETFPHFIGEYQIDRVLGRGGMGTVYLGHHTKLDRAVALKVISRHRLADPKTQSRFAAEMKAVGRMNHPNIVVAHDAREVDGTAVLVTEYIDGLNVGSIIRRVGPLSVGDAAQIACDVARALAAIDDAGLIHRDVKPSNIMVSRSGQVKLLDLGLARLQDLEGEIHEQTATGQALGTVDYIAPEQINEGRNVDVRADIYALGCTLFRMLTGQAVFADDQYATAFAKMTAHVQVKPPSLAQFGTTIPVPVVELVAEMLQKDPALRPQTPQALVERLALFTTGANLSALVEQASTSEEKPRTTARSVSTSAVQRTSTQRGSFLNGRVPFLVGAGFCGLFLGLAIAWMMGIEITIKHPDGTTTKLKVANGSVVSIDEYGNATIELPSATSTSPPAKPPANLNVPADPNVPVPNFPLPTDTISRRELAERRNAALITLTDRTRSSLHPLAGIWKYRDEGRYEGKFLILGREQFSAYNVFSGELGRGFYRTDESVIPRHIDFVEVSQKKEGKIFEKGIYALFGQAGSNKDFLTIYSSKPDNLGHRQPIGDRTELERVDMSTIESVANFAEKGEILRIWEELTVEPLRNSEVPATELQQNEPVNPPHQPKPAAADLVPQLSTVPNANDAAQPNDRNVPGTDSPNTHDPTSRRELTERRNEAFRTLTERLNSSLHPLVGIWKVRDEGRDEGKFLILGRLQYSVYDMGGELGRGSYRTDDSVIPPHIDFEVVSQKKEAKIFGLGIYVRLRETGSNKDFVTIYSSKPDNLGHRPQFGDSESSVRMDLEQADMSTIESVANFAETGEILRIWEELTTEPLTNAEVPTTERQPTESVFSQANRVEQEMAAGNEIEIKTSRLLSGVWRFQNTSRFKGAFLILTNNNKFAIVGGPDEADLAGNFRYDPKTDPATFDLEFDSGSGQTGPQLGICKQILHWAIRTTQETSQVMRATPVEHIELRIWLAPPGKPRLTQPGEGADVLQLLRIDMSETSAKQDLPYEIPAEVRAKWKSMVQQSAGLLILE